MQGGLTIYFRCRRQWTQDRPLTHVPMSRPVRSQRNGLLDRELRWAIRPPKGAVHVPNPCSVMDAAEGRDQIQISVAGLIATRDRTWHTRKNVVHSYAGVREGTISFPIVR